jgi:putative phosphoesterase
LKVAILSDTHGVLRPGLFPLLEGVDHILHAGDIGPVHLLDALEAIAPVTAVFGNTDGFDVRNRLPEIARRRWEGQAVVVVHGHTFGVPIPELLASAFPGTSLVVFGHTHIPLVQRVGGMLAVNPGCCGTHLRGHPPSIALATITREGIDARLLVLPDP